MKRRNFIYFSTMASAYGLLMPKLHAFTTTNIQKNEFISTSLTRQFLMRNIQETIILNRLVNPELCYLATADKNHKVPGNAFSVGTITYLDEAQLSEAFDIAKQKYLSNPLDLKNQELVAFMLGSKLFKAVNDSLRQTDCLMYFIDDKLTVDLDSVILKNYYMKKPFTTEVEVSEVSLFLKTLVSRSQIGYHTLKCQKDDPLAWLEGNVAWKKRLNEYSNSLAQKLVNPIEKPIELSVFNPSDPILQAVSHFHNMKVINKDLIAATLESTDPKSSAVAMALASGIDAFIELDKIW